MWEVISKDLLFSRNDPLDPRLGEKVKSVSGIHALKDSSTVILGYPDAEGLQLNGGRIGESQGPDCIRKYLYKMTPSLSSQSPHTDLFDFGNLKKQGPLTE